MVQLYIVIYTKPQPSKNEPQPIMHQHLLTVRKENNDWFEEKIKCKELSIWQQIKIPGRYFLMIQQELHLVAPTYNKCFNIYKKALYTILYINSWQTFLNTSILMSRIFCSLTTRHSLTHTSMQRKKQIYQSLRTFLGLAVYCQIMNIAIPGLVLSFIFHIPGKWCQFQVCCFLLIFLQLQPPLIWLPLFLAFSSRTLSGKGLAGLAPSSLPVKDNKITSSG